MSDTKEGKVVEVEFMEGYPRDQVQPDPEDVRAAARHAAVPPLLDAGAAAERERIRLELLAEADRLHRLLPDRPSAKTDLYAKALALRDFARRLEAPCDAAGVFNEPPAEPTR